MKPPDFFITTAQQYLNSINEIIQSYISYPIGSKWVDKIQLEKDRAKHEKQQKLISELFLKIKLLFSEFDKGEFFLNRIGSDKNKFQDDIKEKKIHEYKRTLELFIEHIGNFRI